MPRKPRTQAPKSIYHVLSRGNNKEMIFKADSDKYYFLNKLVIAKKKFKFDLYCYAIMPNHFHLLIRPSEKASLSNIMKSLLVSYSNHYNYKYCRVGHVFQDRFKSFICLQNTYLVTLISYIHQNPKRAGLVKNSSDYQFTSINAYLKKADEKLVNCQWIVDFLENTFGQKGTLLIRKLS